MLSDITGCTTSVAWLGDICLSFQRSKSTSLSHRLSCLMFVSYTGFILTSCYNSSIEDHLTLMQVSPGYLGTDGCCSKRGGSQRIIHPSKASFSGQSELDLPTDSRQSWRRLGSFLYFGYLRWSLGTRAVSVGGSELLDIRRMR